MVASSFGLGVEEFCHSHSLSRGAPHLVLNESSSYHAAPLFSLGP